MISDKFAESRAKRGGKMKIENATDAIAAFVATGFGAGLIPFGPGTWGSVVGLLITYALIAAFRLQPAMLQNSIVIVGTILAAIGIWAGTRAEKIFDRKDAGQIVIDEVCGQLISFALIAPSLIRFEQHRYWWLLAGFLLFRLFDIFKPYPLKSLQTITGGLGVMIDDIIAGIYAAVILSLLLSVWPS